ncbi:Set1 complex component spp1 [Ophiocordyceps camponoti-floridani]|uniref:Set1 complex component spp1 n=1 Tax=Ophiocordyceps camponoti-floridani TaxID=2030778 RepID=A0A8H4VCY9_9HYPO|nr:Set1 complex component spp1 [Ophiocordyceps camponoti-floridani]
MEKQQGGVYDDHSRFALIDERTAQKQAAKDSQSAAEAEILAEPGAGSGQTPTSSGPLPSTKETSEATEAVRGKSSAAVASTKKGPKHPRKKPGKTKNAREASDDESDNGPYCICRGPDDHRWMIGCENCEDWFHGECINITKETGESLIEKFICPNCTKGNRITLFKKMCRLDGCRKPARLKESHPSDFCCNDHAQSWWERMLARLPKGLQAPSDQLSQDQLMAILQADIGCVGDDNMWTIARTPFYGELPDNSAGDALSRILSDEEKDILNKAAEARARLDEESVNCHNMLRLLDLVQEDRKANIAAGRCAEDMCGYHSTLDVVFARDVFAAYLKTPEGEATFRDSKLVSLPGAEICERKRCKVHSGWHKMLLQGVKHDMKELANQVLELEEEESIIREAARERWKRKQAENNWVETID